MSDFSAVAITPSMNTERTTHHLRPSLSLNQFGLTPSLNQPSPSPSSYRTASPSSPFERRRRRIPSLPHPTGPTPLSSRIADLANGLLSILWILDPPTPAVDEKRHEHAGGGEGSPAPTPRLGSLISRPRHILQLSRTGYLLVLILMLLGVRELLNIGSAPVTRRARKVNRKDPFATLTPLPTNLNSVAETRHFSALAAAQDHLWLVPVPNSSSDKYPGLDVAVERPDTTAIVLHWKRTDNVAVIVAHLCQYSFFRNVDVWNNNPDIHLTNEMFAASLCPPYKLRIHNSPSNLLFLARYLACSHSTTRNCYFQDDDWLVRPIRAMYSQFKRDTNGPIVVNTDKDTATLYGLEWCFFQAPVLHTCFSWVGTGAFVSRSHATRFLKTISMLPYSRDEMAHADNSFATFMNEPPYVLSSAELDPLPQPRGHSDAVDGRKKNKLFIQQGLAHFIDHLYDISGLSAPPSTPLPRRPVSLNLTSYVTPSPPPLPPHPYAHHARSPCHTDTCLFVTNINLLPPPDAAPYPGGKLTELEDWENHLGWQGRGWIEGGEMFAREETWAGDWAYAFAVDGKLTTAFRSPDVIQQGDYVGLGVLTNIDPRWVPQVDFHFVLEDIKRVMYHLDVEVSWDGYKWVLPYSPNNTIPTPTCHMTSQNSIQPDLSVPISYLSSPAAVALHAKDQHESEESWLGVIGRWWRRRRRTSRHLIECKVALETRGFNDDMGGWRFVRLRSREDARVPWGVYELWMD